jgi:DNA damage-binding protein 1
MFRKLSRLESPTLRIILARIPEATVISLAFLPTEEDQYTIAILFLNCNGRLQLCARDIAINGQELSSHYSFLLQPTLIPDKIVPYPTELAPKLIPVPPNESLEEDWPGTFLGGVLVVGGREILLFDVASLQSQEKQMGKSKRLEAKKKSTDLAEAARARGKEQERMSRIRKPKCSVEWPWGELKACVFIRFTVQNFLTDSQAGWPLINIVLVFCWVTHLGGS